VDEDEVAGAIETDGGGGVALGVLPRQRLTGAADETVGLQDGPVAAAQVGEVEAGAVTAGDRDRWIGRGRAWREREVAAVLRVVLAQLDTVVDEHADGLAARVEHAGVGDEGQAKALAPRGRRLRRAFVRLGEERQVI